MNPSSQSLLDKDKLPSLISELALYPSDRWLDKKAGRQDNIYSTNEILFEVYKEIKETRWLQDITTYLFCKSERLKEINRNRQSTTEFPYIPIPGLKNGKRVLHPCEIGNKKKTLSILTEAPNNRSRELAWVIPYKTETRETEIILIFTFDPLLAFLVRTVNSEWDECTRYWRGAAKHQGLLHEGLRVTCIHTLTGLHEWMTIIETQDGEDTPLSWKRQVVSNKELEFASSVGLDIYYSNSIVAYAWSPIEKKLGRERAKRALQQHLCKRVILFDPIYGKVQGIRAEKEDTVYVRLDCGSTEKDRMARSFWDSTIREAHQTGVSDIHIEPLQTPGRTACDLIISLRKDGQLNFYTKVPSSLSEDYIRYALETSGIIREEAHRPQDGRRSWTNPNTLETIDLRISSTPCGAPVQKIVMRLLDTNKLKRGITDIGLEPWEVDIWERALKLNQSLVLVSGPTNSGKSTTLYAALLTIFQRDNRRSFATIEDPVEYRLPFRSTQSPVNEEKGITYQVLIRQAMRNDGDTFMVGEIRDKDTAAATLQLALTGHQVLSSIHANSATETALRLLEFGVDNYILGETLKLVVAQRLVPTACPDCSRPLEPTAVKHLLRKHGGEILLQTADRKWEEFYKHKAKWVEPEGCPSCNFTGVKGMRAIQEFLVIDSKNKKALKEGNIKELEASMLERSHPKMEETAWRMAWRGLIPMSQAGELTDQLKSY